MYSLMLQLRDWGMFFMEFYVCYILTMEYNYDAAKDEARRQRKTRTTKKTSTSPSGDQVTEEQTEIVESKGD